jgi:hypothetical protein
MVFATFEEARAEARRRLHSGLIAGHSPEDALAVVEAWIHRARLPSDWKDALWLFAWSELPLRRRQRIVGPELLSTIS